MSWGQHQKFNVFKKGNSLQRGRGGQEPMSYFSLCFGHIDFLSQSCMYVTKDNCFEYFKLYVSLIISHHVVNDFTDSFFQLLIH